MVDEAFKDGGIGEKSSGTSECFNVVVVSVEDDYVHCIEVDEDNKPAFSTDLNDTIVLKRSALVDQFLNSMDDDTVLRVSGENCGVERKLLDVNSIEDLTLQP